MRFNEVKSVRTGKTLGFNGYSQVNVLKSPPKDLTVLKESYYFNDIW